MRTALGQAQQSITSRGGTLSIPLDPGAPACTHPLGTAPGHSPQPHTLRPLQRPPPRAPGTLRDKWDRTVEVQLSRIQEAPDTDTKVEASRARLRLTVSPGKGKHRRILARLQTAQSEGL
jgi:hypothetical protein